MFKLFICLAITISLFITVENHYINNEWEYQIAKRFVNFEKVSWYEGLIRMIENYQKPEENNNLKKYGGIPRERYMKMQQKLEQKLKEKGGKYLSWIPKLKID